MLWWAAPDAVRDYRARLRDAGGTGPVAAAMRLAPSLGHWLENCVAYAEAGTDLLILTSYGRGARIVEELEQFATEIIPRLSNVGVPSTGRVEKRQGL
jgi:hypothetical protein